MGDCGVVVWPNCHFSNFEIMIVSQDGPKAVSGSQEDVFGFWQWDTHTQN